MKKVGNTVDTFVRYLNKLYMFVALLMLGIVVICLFLQVFTRYVLNSSMTGTEEIAKYAMVWMAMLGVGICVGDGACSSVTLVSDLMKTQKGKRIFAVLVAVSEVILALIMVIQGFKATATANNITPTLAIPYKAIYISIAFAGIGILFNAINNTFKLLIQLTDKNIEKTGEEGEK